MVSQSPSRQAQLTPAPADSTRAASAATAEKIFFIKPPPSSRLGSERRRLSASSGPLRSCWCARRPAGRNAQEDHVCDVSVRMCRCVRRGPCGPASREMLREIVPLGRAWSVRGHPQPIEARRWPPPRTVRSCSCQRSRQRATGLLVTDGPATRCGSPHEVHSNCCCACYLLSLLWLMAFAHAAAVTSTSCRIAGSYGYGPSGPDPVAGRDRSACRPPANSRVLVDRGNGPGTSRLPDPAGVAR